jgi:hypothetical protein
MSTIRITLELSTADPNGDASELWREMVADFKDDSRHKMVLETGIWWADVRPVE